MSINNTWRVALSFSLVSRPELRTQRFKTLKEKKNPAVVYSQWLGRWRQLIIVVPLYRLPLSRCHRRRWLAPSSSIHSHCCCHYHRLCWLPPTLHTAHKASRSVASTSSVTTQASLLHSITHFLSFSIINTHYIWHVFWVDYSSNLSCRHLKHFTSRSMTVP